jgi:hypothetical protein
MKLHLADLSHHGQECFVDLIILDIGENMIAGQGNYQSVIDISIPQD